MPTSRTTLIAVGTVVTATLSGCLATAGPDMKANQAGGFGGAQNARVIVREAPMSGQRESDLSAEALARNDAARACGPTLEPYVIDIRREQVNNTTLGGLFGRNQGGAATLERVRLTFICERSRS